MEFLMVVGIPGSGKSYFTKNYESTHIILSSDNIRDELGITEQDSKSHAVVFDELHRRMIFALTDNKNVIYDATNLSGKRRRNVLRMIERFNPYKKVVVVATPVNKCIENNLNRDRQVPKRVIYDMVKSFEMPFTFSEGWDNVEIYYPFDIGNWNILLDFINKEYEIEQDNPHHTLTIQQHMLKCAHSLTGNHILKYAAILHDTGKKYTKTFKNKKGVETEHAHYYGHESVSAYNALFYLKDRLFSFEETLEIIFYVQKHMIAHNFSNMKPLTRQKYRDLYGEDRINNLLLFHQADSAAK